MEDTANLASRQRSPGQTANTPGLSGRSLRSCYNGHPSNSSITPPACPGDIYHYAWPVTFFSIVNPIHIWCCQCFCDLIKLTSFRLLTPTGYCFSSRRIVANLATIFQRWDLKNFNNLCSPFKSTCWNGQRTKFNCCFVSLRPSESVAAAAGKIKGRLSKRLNQNDPSGRTKQLSRGYGALSIGKSTARAVELYLERQAQHHGYQNRARPPIFVGQSDQLTGSSGLNPIHAVSRIRYHIVLATEFRRGVFTRDAGAALFEHWKNQQNEGRFAIQKVSFVPDHVHLAVLSHPSCTPAGIILRLMNSAQSFLWKKFANLAIEAKIRRLWQPTAYFGTFGDLPSPAVSAYVKNMNRQ